MFKILDGRSKFYQWDLNRKLIIEDPTITEVHFCNRTDVCSIVCEVYTEDGLRLVNVPNILLQVEWRFRVYAYDSEYTKHEECYEVVGRTKPASYVYTETEVKTWNGLEREINDIKNEVKAVEQEVAQAEQELAKVNETISPLTNGAFTNALKGNKFGSMVLLDDVSPVAHKINIKAEPKNILPATYANKVLKGITFTTNDDWSISLNGTWNGSASAEVADLYLMSNYQLPTGTYVLSGGNDGGGTYSYRLFGQVIRANGTPVYISITDSKTSSAFVINEGDLFTLSIRIGNEIGTVNNLTFYPMLERGVVASPYAPPFADLSYSQISVKGKNLFDDTYFYNYKGFTYDEQKKAWFGESVQEPIFYNYAGAQGSFTIQCEAMNTAANKKSIYFLVDYTDGTQKYLVGSNIDSYGMKFVSAQTDATKTVEKISWSYSNEGSFYVRNTMISYAPTVSEYEPYVEYHTTLTIGDDGLTLDSHYPSMTIYNEYKDAIIDVEYNRDINKAFAELYNAILSTGGNV